MTYEEFRSEILRKLEEKKNDLGYEQVKYYPDGFTSEEPGELSTIRNTNVKYHKMESDVLSGDFIILLVESQQSWRRHHIGIIQRIIPHFLLRQSPLLKKGSMSPRQILNSIKHVNKTFDPSEILSRKVYLYDTATKERWSL